MPAPLSLDLRRRILAASLDGMLSTTSLARRFKVAPATAWRIIARYKDSGSADPHPHGGGREAAIPASKEHRVDALLEKKLDATTEELAHAYNQRWKATVTRSSMGRSLVRMALTSKKAYRATEQTRGDGVERRRIFERQQKRLNSQRLVFLDETGLNRAIIKARAWAPKGQPAVSLRLGGRGKNITTMGAIRQ